MSSPEQRGVVRSEGGYGDEWCMGVGKVGVVRSGGCDEE